MLDGESLSICPSSPNYFNWHFNSIHHVYVLFLDAANPVLTGLLRVLQNDVKLYVRIYSYNDPKSLAASPENITLFGECPIEVQPKGDIIAFVDGVIDSSRYYVVRMQDRASTRTTMIGIGFRDREVAFDFKNALNEYVRYVDRMARAGGSDGPAEDKDKNTFTFGGAGSPDEDEHTSVSAALNKTLLLLLQDICRQL